jgi:pyruvate-formate lyase-activating enzyme
MVLSYKTRSNGGDWVDQKYPVHIVRTACNYGGTRAWFLCPAMGCHKRVAVLYGGSVFACRTCHNLNYRSQQESKLEQPCTQADKIRERLGWQAGILNGSGTKPKGMHQTTYRRLVYRHDVLMGRAIGAIRGRFKF